MKKIKVGTRSFSTVVTAMKYANRIGVQTIFLPASRPYRLEPNIFFVSLAGEGPNKYARIVREERTARRHEELGYKVFKVNFTTMTAEGVKFRKRRVRGHKRSK